jgi:hypothetical protein
MKTEVYSWRLAGELKSYLEREARLRNLPVSSILDMAVRDWLMKSGVYARGDEDMQSKLHAAAASCLGVLAGGNPRRAETARKAIRKRLRRRHAG